MSVTLEQSLSNQRPLLTVEVLERQRTISAARFFRRLCFRVALSLRGWSEGRRVIDENLETSLLTVEVLEASTLLKTSTISATARRLILLFRFCVDLGRAWPEGDEGK